MSKPKSKVKSPRSAKLKKSEAADAPVAVQRIFHKKVSAATVEAKPKKPVIPRPALHRALERLGSSFDKQAYALRLGGLEVSGSYLSMLVRGVRTPGVDLARQLAKALSVDIKVVIGE